MALPQQKIKVDIFDERGRLAKMLLIQRMQIEETQTRVGNVISVSFQQIQKNESGLNGIPAEKLLMICRAFGYDFDVITNGNPYEEINKIHSPKVKAKVLHKFKSIDLVMQRHRSMAAKYEKILPVLELEMNYQKAFLTPQDKKAMAEAEEIYQAGARSVV